jgi:hypothetical protein
MVDSPFRLLAELSRTDGTPIGACPVEPDWQPAEESLRFQALRRNRVVGAEALARIVPVWDTAGPPFVRGMHAALDEETDEPIGCDLPLTYFRTQVNSAAARLLGDQWAQERTVHYGINAFPLEHEVHEKAERPWVIREVVRSPIRGERRMSDLLTGSLFVGASESNADDFPVFIPASVLHAAEELKTAAGENETGGILIGHLWRDVESLEIFAEVTALIPARHTTANSTKLTFSPQTWDAVHTAIAVRAKDEIWLGWHHTHPSRYWCKCGPEAQKTCSLGRQFFSADDVALHRTVFSKGFHIALVTGDRPLLEGGWESVHTSYGWRHGIVESRGFYLSDPAGSATA